MVVSGRMELMYVNTAARSLVPWAWFGKRCFEVLPVVEEMCTFYCPKIQAVNEATEVVYCEESVRSGDRDCVVFGVGLIPLGLGADDRARAVFLLRSKTACRDEREFQAHLLKDAERVRQRIFASTAGVP